MMTKTICWLLLIAALGGAIALYFWSETDKQPPSVLEAPAAPEKPSIRHPIEAARSLPAPPVLADKPLPELADSDGAIREMLEKLFAGNLEQYFNLQKIVHRFVATVDNLPRETAPLQLMPVKPVPGWTATEGKSETLALSPKNSTRYKSYIRLAESVPTGLLVAAYVRFYPLFQEQYERLGYPGKYFNDRLMEVIDHLLAAPEVVGPVLLTQTHVLYQFTDPSLERLSAGQKILIRMGSDNAVKVKAKLREIRDAFTPKKTKG